jgi:hypothetical protein
MLFVFLALYCALGVWCIVAGARRGRRSAVVCGVIAVAIALVSFAVWVLSALGASHWTVSLLQVLLSPMPESVLQPDSLDAATQGAGVPVFAFAALELIVAIVLWAVPIFGLIIASRSPRTEPGVRDR